MKPWGLTAKQKDDIVSRYSAGEKVAFIAALHGVTDGWVATLSRRQGIPARLPCKRRPPVMRTRRALNALLRKHRYLSAASS